MKKIFSIVLAGILACTVFAGCEGKSASGDDSLKKIMDKGEFAMGLDDSFPPMGFRNADNEIVGFDIDCAKEVTKRMGVELKLVPINWDTKEIELDSGNIDCIWNGMSVDPERAEAMNLSEPYMTNRMILMVLADSEYTSKEQLAGKTIGVQQGSTAQKILEESEFFGTIKENVGFKDNVTACLDLETGGVDAVFLDEVVASAFINVDGKPYRILDDGALTEEGEEYAIGFRKADQALRDEVQKHLFDMKADGTLAKISEKWFSKDITTVK